VGRYWSGRRRLPKPRRTSHGCAIVCGSTWKRQCGS
jgi:hypothetical protein